MTKAEAIEQLRRLAELKRKVDEGLTAFGLTRPVEESDFVYAALDTDWPALLAAVEGKSE